MNRAAGDKRGVRRAALGGLSAGLFAGAAYLGVAALIRRSGPDCAQLSPQECALQREIEGNLARWQALAALALALLSVALWMLLRARARAG